MVARLGFGLTRGGEGTGGEGLQGQSKRLGSDGIG